MKTEDIEKHFYELGKKVGHSKFNVESFIYGFLLGLEISSLIYILYAK